MFKLTYACNVCTFKSEMLMDAQKHSDSTGHSVHASGLITPSETVADVRKLDRNDKLRRQAYEAEILRRARDKGFVRAEDAKP